MSQMSFQRFARSPLIQGLVPAASSASPSAVHVVQLRRNHQQGLELSVRAASSLDIALLRFGEDFKRPPCARCRLHGPLKACKVYRVGAHYLLQALWSHASSRVPDRWFVEKYSLRPGPKDTLSVLTPEQESFIIGLKKPARQD